MNIKKYIRKFLVAASGGYHKPILSLRDGNHLIKELLESKYPVLISRLGATEAHCCWFYIRRIHKPFRHYPEAIKKSIRLNAGFFPTSDLALDEFSRTYLKSMEQINALGVWQIRNENLIAKQYCHAATLIPLQSIEPYFHNDPWSTVLAHKKVLVVSPFAETILDQYKKREHIFSNKKILPEFELSVLKPVWSIADEKPAFATWFEALDFMRGQIRKIDFDIALIGAGSYGLPLAAFAKELGKKVIHMAGATQLLFGIKGRRWDKHEFISRLYNEYWVRPSESERPTGYKKVEQGCYW